MILLWVSVFIILCVCSIILTSPYLLVFGDDHVTCYKGENDVLGEPSDAQSQNEGNRRDYFN